MHLKTTFSVLLTCFFMLQVFGQCPTIQVFATDVVCAGDNDGTVTIQASGGLPPYEYSIDGGLSYQTNNTFTSLAPVCDSAMVRDALNCITGREYCINEPSFTIWVETINDISCNGACDGSGKVFTNGGAAPYLFVWDGIPSAAQTNSNLCAGTYAVTVVDANGCEQFASLTITEPPVLEVNLSSTAETCLGQDGSISTNVSGGTPPFLFQWNNGATTQNLLGLSAGFYDLSVSDANFCFVNQSIEIEAYIDIDFTVTPATCDQADGTATATVTGINNPIFLWNNGQTTSTATGLAQGWYSLTVEETGTGCNAHQNVYIDEELSCKVLIDGYIYNDDGNKDCITDASTIPLINHYVVLKSGAAVIAATFTDSTGYYDLIVDKGVYDLEIMPNAVDSFLCPSTNNISVNATNNGQSYSNDFYLGKKEIQDLKVYLNMRTARPGFSQIQKIYYCNKGAYPMDGTVTFKHDSILTNFTNGSETSYDAQTHTATWDFTGLAPGQCGTIVVEFMVPASAQIGTLLTGEATVDPIAGDISPNNNSVTSYIVVTGSFDPNDKQNMSSRDPFGGDIHPDIETYHYKVRFQNTGTDTAFTVVIKDEIEANLDISSVRTVAASHDYSMDVEDGNTLVFFFQDIMLPDSNVNEPASHGFVYFTIGKAPNLPLGTAIKNDAAIYFDFNDPVITNEVVNVLAVPSGIKPNADLAFSATIYPNPASESPLISLKLEQATELDLSILDAQGRKLVTLTEERFSKGMHHIPLDVALNTGMYFLQIKSKEGILTKKFVLVK